MPQAHHCCIPGCSEKVSEQQKSSSLKERLSYTHFHSPSPKFAKNNEDREWRENMMKIVLRYRVPKKSQIMQQYHRDQVRVCERHFAEEDIITKPVEGSAGRFYKRLRIGALPHRNLPKKGGQLLPNPYAKPILKKQGRKPPSDRVLTPFVKHKTFAKLISSAKRLMVQKNIEWNIQVEEDIIQITKPDAYGNDQNQFMIWIKDDFKIGISCFSWSLPESHSLSAYDLRINTLHAFLKHVESMKLCKGVIVPVGVQELDLVTHILTKRANPFSCNTVSSSILAHRSSKCEVLVESEENHCKVCNERNKVLVRKWCENQVALQQPRKRINPFEVDHFMEKRLKYSVKQTENGLRAVLKVEGLEKEGEELTKKNIRPELDIPSKDDWMKPVQKYAEMMNKGSKVFEMFWVSQASKLYQSVTKQQLEKYVGQHYPKELMEFWSEVWQSGKAAYKILVHSGMLAMPSPTHIAKYMKKKLENVENTITQVTDASKNAQETIDSTDVDKPISLSVSERNSILTEALQQSDLPSNPSANEMRDQPSLKQDQMQLLVVGDEPGQRNVIPVALIQPPSEKPSSYRDGVRLATLQQPGQHASVTSNTTVSPSVFGFISVQQQATMPCEDAIRLNEQVRFQSVQQCSQQMQSPSANSTLPPIQHIRLVPMQQVHQTIDVSHPDISADWGHEVVVTTDGVLEDL